MKNLLIIRFSALGDVAMTVPVIDSLARQYPNMSITMLSKKAHAPLFANLPDNVKFWGVDLKKDYKGICGLNRLYKEIKGKHFDAIADFHNVLRTIFLRLRGTLGGIRTAHIHKGRDEKKALVKEGAGTEVLDSSFVRYNNVLKELGLEVDLNFTSIFEGKTVELPEKVKKLAGDKNCRWVGIAPFAAHKGKIFPLDKMQQVAKQLADKNYKVFLFGAGKKETEILESWQDNNIINTAGRLGGMANELMLMSKLDAMVSMDSANMHMASLVNTRVVSVWGATHPNAGFLGWKQSTTDIVQLNMPCRPCSIYGSKPCKLKDNQYGCMNNIDINCIIGKIERL